MLEIKLLKVYHSGKKEAKKALPYLKGADIISPENSTVTEAEASRGESEFEKAITSWISNEQFFKSFRVRYERAGAKPDIRKYITAIYGEAFKGKIPLWYLERFGAEKSAEQRRSRNEFVHKMELSYDLFVKGDEKEFLKVNWEGLQLNKQMSLERDKEIAKNIDEAEKRIRGRYGRLKSKEPLKLVAVLGGEHFPERYTNHPLEIIDLMGNEVTPMSELHKALRNNLSFEEAKPFMLEAVRHDLAKGLV